MTKMAEKMAETTQFLEMVATPKSQKNDDIDTDELLQLLIQKDKELKEQLKIAEEQAEIEKRAQALKAEVDRRDDQIKQLQRSLKEAESILGTAIYQAKQKLASIERANSRKISPEELIKYAHKISASNAVAAPPVWGTGDPRRPYPTDMEMRGGVLARLSDTTINQQALSSGNTLSEVLGHGRQPVHIGLQQPQQPPLYQWQSSLESLHGGGAGGGGAGGQTPTHPGLPSHSPRAPPSVHHVPPVEVAPSRADDVGLMSSDSSSSSSSDE